MEDSKAKLLIVDDTPAGRQVLQILLLEDAYELHFAATGREAVEQLAKLRPDLILMDVLMPGMDGFEATRRLREIPVQGDVPVFLVTALDDPASRQKGYDSGADEYITKPFHSAELRARIRNVLRLNRFGRLRAERERYARLFYASPDSILIVGRDGTILGANDAAAHLLEVPFADRARGLDLISRLEDASQMMLIYLLSSIGSPAARPARNELKLITHGSGVRQLEIAHATTEWGGVAALQIIARDVTEMRQLEEQYRQSQRMETVGQLTAGIAHDFSNVLSIINAYSALLLHTVEEGDPNRRGIQAISDAADRATQLASQVLYFSRKLPFAPRVLDLNTLLANLEPMLNRLVGDLVEIQVEPAVALEPVRVDPSQLEQAILNLAANARDALPGGGRLTLLTGNEFAPSAAMRNIPRFVFLRVMDTGCGMAENTRRHIFEPFFTTKGQSGTGLGLTNVQRIVKQHHGFIRVESVVDRGTEVTLYLPSVAGQPLEEVASHQPALSPVPVLESDSRLILVVWEDFLERNYLVEILQAYGFHTWAMESLSDPEAFPAQEAKQVDLIIAGSGNKQLTAVLKQTGCDARVLTLAQGQPTSPGHLLRKVAAALK